MSNRNPLQTNRPREVVRAIGDVTVALRSDLPEVVHDFCQLYPQAPERPVSKHPPIQLEVKRCGRSKLGRKLYRVFADGNEVGGWRPANGVFPFVEWGINLRVMATRSEYLQLHASSMEHDGEGFIFAGDSGCGKSTLAATLLAHGWRYFCDEFALIDPRDVRLHPYPKALCIKSGSFSHVRRLGLPFARRRDYVKAFKGPVGYIDPRAAGDDRVATPTNLRFIIFPKFGGNARPRLEEVSAAEAVMALLCCCFNKQVFPDGALPALTRVVNDCRCFRLTVGAPGATAALLNELTQGKHADENKVKVLRPAPARSLVERGDGEQPSRTRRDMLRIGAKLAYAAGPTFLAISARQAMAAASDPSGICSGGINTGDICETDSDCCTNECNLGICK